MYNLNLVWLKFVQAHQIHLNHQFPFLSQENVPCNLPFHLLLGFGELKRWEWQLSCRQEEKNLSAAKWMETVYLYTCPKNQMQWENKRARGNTGQTYCMSFIRHREKTISHGALFHVVPVTSCLETWLGAKALFCFLVHIFFPLLHILFGVSGVVSHTFSCLNVECLQLVLSLLKLNNFSCPLAFICFRGGLFLPV